MKSINQRKSVKIYQVDVFTDRSFKGNPAAVCILEEPIEDKMMQAIAMEMNLSETAFVLPKENNFINGTNIFSLRWFTPKVEVPLCGHATLATSAVLFNEIKIPYDEIIYETKSGKLLSKRYKDGIILDFPIDKPVSSNFFIKPELLKVMGISKYKNIILGKKTKKLVIHLENYREVLNLKPNFELMKQLDMEDIKGVGITAKAEGEYDFVSRYFNPWAGVNEDPVTGSVHTLLAYYWSGILNKRELKAYQASKRGGEIILRLKGDIRLEIVGKYKIILRGEICID
jgi:PhzF family phenazine biosynthesis protein